ncbi:bifunctional helix-turn-helix transcriptional regulator/GNAT family N-acetyltransferase [Pyxidicoccus xibeiensis]|uniref:bifunctional helix-turn-helix transcriptional regulator/GNAT family N-acetyltransferase n=1 Tax=Pyxidicoccus xibeiensis TaxID=2906759 RepID=UPI0020A770D5|nr:helix-turn-helix domain-containing GNAT family N-acetyltransferase [Pyxidicoccus xibeiensis]MCP3142317.1 helix-turn-helix domain-containing GNAT family N-acetyltransferase [Pyxidicoccus xibeiensis]
MAERNVAAVRHFNRFYTQKIGVLPEGHLESDFSLTEVRVLYELANREQPTAAELSRELGLDPGYLSRVLRSFGTRGLVAREPSKADGRQSLVRLTRRGQDAFARLNTRSSEEVAALLSRLSPAEQRRLLDAMRTIEELLGGKPEAAKAPYLLRQHRPGDMGWVIHRHGVLYSQEYGWDERFEALVASIAAKFIQEYEPKRERCWIAEKDGENVGSVFLVQESKTVAKLRLLLVEPSARGLGIGARLVDECVRFAREAGYRKIRLWTNDTLHAARHIYERAGFVLVHTEPHAQFGEGLVGETWELTL